MKCVSAEKNIANHPHRLTDHWVRPEPPQVGNCVDHSLLVLHSAEEDVQWDSFLLEQPIHTGLVAFDKADNTFPEVLRDVLCFIFEASFHPAAELLILGIFLDLL